MPAGRIEIAGSASDGDQGRSNVYHNASCGTERRKENRGSSSTSGKSRVLMSARLFSPVSPAKNGRLHREKGETLMMRNEGYKPSITYSRVVNLKGGSRGQRWLDDALFRWYIVNRVRIRFTRGMYRP